MPDSPKVILFADFDGTITGQEGSQTINSDFFQSLLEGYTQGVYQDYKYTQMKEKEIQSLFIKNFGKYNPQRDYTSTGFLMGAAAVAFFREALNNSQVKVNIVTKNREQYIKELFLYQGFSEIEISKLTILDSPVGKGALVTQIVERIPFIPGQIVYILDDNRNDYNAMVNAINIKNKDSLVQVNGHPERSAGSFNWAFYLEEIKSHTVGLPHQIGYPERSEGRRNQALNNPSEIPHSVREVLFSTRGDLLPKPSLSNLNPDAPIFDGVFKKYANKPGCHYLVFTSIDDRNNTIKEIQQLGIAEAAEGTSTLASTQGKLYRISFQKNTIEITLDAKNLIEQVRASALQPTEKTKISPVANLPEQKPVITYTRLQESAGLPHQTPHPERSEGLRNQALHNPLKLPHSLRDEVFFSTRGGLLPKSSLSNLNPDAPILDGVFKKYANKLGCHYLVSDPSTTTPTTPKDESASTPKLLSTKSNALTSQSQEDEPQNKSKLSSGSITKTDKIEEDIYQNKTLNKSLLFTHTNSEGRVKEIDESAQSTPLF